MNSPIRGCASSNSAATSIDSLVVSRKLGMLWPEIREVLEAIRAVCRVEPLGLETHDFGLALAERYGFSIYDGTILASAQLADCRVVFTEDLQHGRVIDERLKTINPFSAGRN
mgnify:FL=1